MADKPIAGSTSYSTDIVLRSSTDGTELSGKVAADLSAAYWRQGGSPTAITLSDLAAIGSAWSSGGVKEASSTVAKGSYRLDLPDAALATGADWVEINASCTGSYVFKERIMLPTASVASIPAAVWAVGTRTLTSFGTLVADIWASATRTLSSFGFTVTLAQSVWAETPTTSPGTAGQLLTSAGGAADPLLNAVPGSYAAGTAGAALGAIGTDSTSIAAIKTKTDQLTFSTPNVVDSSATGGLTAASIAAAVLNTAMTEGYAADGVQATLAQMAYMLWAAAAAEKVITGTDVAVKGLDGATTVMHFTLNSATNPTSITRAS